MGAISEKSGLPEKTKTLISAIAVIVVNLLAVFGLSADVDLVTDIICALAWAASIAWAIWKNHNFTVAAQHAQEFLDVYKLAEKDEDEENAKKALAMAVSEKLNSGEW